MIEALKEVREALETGLYASREVAANVHVSLAGYKPEKHKAVDADVAQIEAAITKLDALIAQEKAEPVACIYKDRMYMAHEFMSGIPKDATLLYAAPQSAPSTSQPTECKVICELCKKRGYNFCANVAKTTPINLQAAPSTSQTLTDIDIAAAIEVADAKWADADVPLGWAKHFARAIEAKIGAKP